MSKRTMSGLVVSAILCPVVMIIMNVAKEKEEKIFKDKISRNESIDSCYILLVCQETFHYSCCSFSRFCLLGHKNLYIE